MSTPPFRKPFSTQLVLSIVLAGLLLWLLITYGALIMEVFAILLGAALLSLAMRPTAAALDRWRIPRGVTVLLIYLLILAAIAGIGTLTGTAISQQAQRLAEVIPDLPQEALDRLRGIPQISQFIPSLDRVVDTVSQWLEGLARTALDAATSVGRAVVDLLMVLIIAFFFTTDKKLGRTLLDTWVPDHQRERVDAVVSNASRRLSRWVRVQLVIIAYFSIVYGTGLLIIGVPFAMVIGLIGGVLELVPYLGGATALTLSVLAALTVKPQMVIWVLILYVVVTQVEGNIIIPTLYGAAVDVHPVLVVLALLVGATAGGIFGALFAVPVAVVITAVIQEIRRPPGSDEPPPAGQSPADGPPQPPPEA